MTKAPFIRRRRAAIVVGPLPAVAGLGASLATILALGTVLYMADVSLYDLAFHPLHSLRGVIHGAGDLIVVAARALPFLLNAAILVILARVAWAVGRRRREGSIP
jgi:hypothetical protein